MKENKIRRLLFVCLGNICRSPAAEGVMRRLVEERGLGSEFEIDSAATHNYHTGDLPDRRMRVHARRRGLELTHIVRRVTDDDFDHFDLILGMDASNLSDLRWLAPSPEGAAKVVNLGKYIRLNRHYDHIPDPYYEGSEGFELVLDLLEDACENLLETILEQDNNTK